MNIVDSNVVNSIINNNSIKITSIERGKTANYELFSKADLATTTRGILGMGCKDYELRKRVKYSDVGTVLYLSFNEIADSWWRESGNYTILIKELSSKRIKGVLLDDNTSIEISVMKLEESLTDKILKIEREDVIGNYAIYRDKEKFEEEIKMKRNLIHIGYSELQLLENNSYILKFKGETKSGSWRIGKEYGLDYLEMSSNDINNGAEFDTSNILLLVDKTDRYLVFESPTCNLRNDAEGSFNLVKLK